MLNVALWHAWWGGWNWGPRLVIPALPLLAILGAAGLGQFKPRMRSPIAALLLALGSLWAIPAVLTNLLGGYAGAYDSTAGSFRLQAYPPLGAWTFFQHWRSLALTDATFEPPADAHARVPNPARGRTDVRVRFSRTAAPSAWPGRTRSPAVG